MSAEVFKLGHPVCSIRRAKASKKIGFKFRKCVFYQKILMKMHTYINTDISSSSCVSKLEEKGSEQKLNQGKKKTVSLKLF
jgi:hypothetical protein